MLRDLRNSFLMADGHYSSQMVVAGTSRPKKMGPVQSIGFVGLDVLDLELSGSRALKLWGKMPL